MRGFIRQRGDAWELRVYLGQDAVTGKKRYATKTMRRQRREADRVLARMVAEADHGTFARTSATVGELLERWFEQAAMRLLAQDRSWRRAATSTVTCCRRSAR